MVGRRRCDALLNHEIAAVRVPFDKKSAEGKFQWLSNEPDVTRDDLICYTDGSPSDPLTPELSAIGYSIVVVSKAGDLIAYGTGTPPEFVCDSGMAETWAVYTVVAMFPFLPDIVTDCLGIVETAKAGTTAATAASAPNARIWRMMASALDGDVSKLCDKISWMPAHQTVAAIERRVKSNNREVNSLDWRVWL